VADVSTDGFDMTASENAEHRMAFPPRAVYDAGGDEHGQRLGYVTSCTCGVGYFGDKASAWEQLATHMIVSDPILRAIAKQLQEQREAPSWSDAS
jgi:hypothetical protein